MLKRLICLILTAALFLTITSVPASAEAPEDYVIYLENGDYIEVQICNSPARTSTSGSATYTYRSTSGVAQWKAVLRGVFQYDGTTSKATSSVCDVTIYDDAWEMESKSVWTSGSTAYASVVMSRTSAFGTVSTKTYDLSLTCDKNGNLS